MFMEGKRDNPVNFRGQEVTPVCLYPDTDDGPPAVMMGSSLWEVL